MGLPEEYAQLMNEFEFNKAFDFAWERVQGLNRKIDDEKPWMLAKNGEKEKLMECLDGLVRGMLDAARLLEPFIPETVEKIRAVFTDPIAPPETPLFPKN